MCFARFQVTRVVRIVQRQAFSFSHNSACCHDTIRCASTAGSSSTVLSIPSSFTLASGSLKFAVKAEACQTQGPLAVYESLVQDGELKADENQQHALSILTAIYFGAQRRQSKGLYIYGGVGCGKTMMMDLFYICIRHTALRTQRIHFHDFLSDVHVRLHRLQFDNGIPVKADGRPIDRLAKQISDEIDVLCFDEFAITTIQDCCILMPLFQQLFQRRVIVVATSNRAPEDLYTDGLNRHLYLPPFLDTLKVHCKVHFLDSRVDYRAKHSANSPDAGVFCWPTCREFVDRWFERVAGSSGCEGSLSVSYGRSLSVPWLSDCKRVARFAFNDLCMNHLSPDDFVMLCVQVHTILLDDIPCLTVDNHNEARRFTSFIDCCYENHVRLICSMAAPPDELLGELSKLRDINMAVLGANKDAGCGDGDTASSSSGVLAALSRVKQSIADRDAREQGPNTRATSPVPGSGMTSVADGICATDVLGAEMKRVKAHGDKDIKIWRQTEASDGQRASPPQVSRAWDDRRRITAFTWESADPTAEQQTVKGVFTAAIASLQESGFAVDRAVSRLKEMQTVGFQDFHRIRHQLDE